MIIKCFGCDSEVDQYSDVFLHQVGDRRYYLCTECWEKVARGGREPHQVMEAILIFHNDPEVGGPGDPLDHEDYRDLELLGLLEE